MMDQSKFLDRAPIYYALAIFDYLLDKENGGFTLGDVKENFSSTFLLNGNIVHKNLLPCVPLLENGLALLQKYDFFEIIPVDFGDDVIFMKEDFLDKFKILRDINPIANLYQRHSNGKKWLLQTLLSLDQRRIDLGFDESLRVSGATESQDIAQIDEWRPLPIDRDAAVTQQAINDLDNARDALASDNGFSANNPEERNLIVADFKMVVDRFKTDDIISFGWIQKKCLDHFPVLVRKFREAAIEAVILTAWESIKLWIRSKGIPIP